MIRTLAAEEVGRQAMQLRKYDLEKARLGVPVAVTPLLEEASEFVGSYIHGRDWQQL